MDPKLSQPRRIATALLIAFLSGTTGIFALAATEPIPANGIQGTVSLPMVRVGDHVVYNKTAPDEQPFAIDARWVEDGRAPEEGRWTVANRVVLREQALYVSGTTSPFETTALLRPEDGAPLGRGAIMVFNETSPANLFTPPGTSSSSEDLIMQESFSQYAGNFVPCGLRHAFQGRTVDVSQSVPESHGCKIVPSGQPDLAWEWRVTDLAGPDGRQTFSADLHMRELRMAGGESDQVMARFTFREDLAYPVTMEFLDGAAGVYVLVGHTGGNHPVAGSSLTLEVPEVTLAPRQPWGPSEEGATHPFPLSEAWRRAQAEPSTGLAGFLQRHPDAYVGNAQYQENTADVGRASRTWVFLVADGDKDEERLGLRVDQVRGMLGLPMEALGQYRFDTYDISFFAPYRFVAADALPSQVPTVKSVSAAWSALTAEAVALEPNAWGVRWMCKPDEEGCRPDHFVSAGAYYDHVATLPDANASTMRRSITWSSLEVAPDGAPVRLMLRWINDETRVAPFVPAPAGSSAPEAVAPVPFGARLALTPAQATGLGVASVLAGLLYWAWPALKSGVSGLFSRVQGPKLLDHPLRAAIVHHVEANPGVHHQQLARALGKGKGTIEHHLAKLVAAGLVQRFRGTGYTCYFPQGTDAGQMAGAPVLKSDVAREVHRMLVQEPGLPLTTIAVRLGVSVPTVHYHVQRLRASGVAPPA